MPSVELGGSRAGERWQLLGRMHERPSVATFSDRGQSERTRRSHGLRGGAGEGGRRTGRPRRARGVPPCRGESAWELQFRGSRATALGREPDSIPRAWSPSMCGTGGDKRLRRGRSLTMAGAGERFVACVRAVARAGARRSSTWRPHGVDDHLRATWFSKTCLALGRS